MRPSVCLSVCFLSVCLSVCILVCSFVCDRAFSGCNAAGSRKIHEAAGTPFCLSNALSINPLFLIPMRKSSERQDRDEDRDRVREDEVKICLQQAQKSFCIYECVHKSDSGIYAAVNSTIISRSARLSTRPKRPRATSRLPFSWA